jgi:hypothetical protein
LQLVKVGCDLRFLLLEMGFKVLLMDLGLEHQRHGVLVLLGHFPESAGSTQPAAVTHELGPRNDRISMALEVLLLGLLAQTLRAETDAALT